MPRKMLSRSQIIKTLKDQMPELRNRYSVRSLGLFGSFARDEAREGSDVDLLVEFDQTPSLFKLIELEQHLGDLLDSKVDLTIKRTLKPQFSQRILSDVVPI